MHRLLEPRAFRAGFSEKMMLEGTLRFAAQWANGERDELFTSMGHTANLMLKQVQLIVQLPKKA